MEWFRVNISRNVIVFIEILKEGRYMNLKRICIEEILKHKFYPIEICSTFTRRLSQNTISFRIWINYKLLLILR